MKSVLAIARSAGLASLSRFTRFTGFTALTSLALLAGCAPAAPAKPAAPVLPTGAPKPESMTVDPSVSPERAQGAADAAGFFYAFWDTGDPSYADRALSPAFVDRTLPRGRPQGPDGVKAASKGFRSAVPDLKCTISELLIVGDKVVARLVFTGTHTGAFGGKPATGKSIRFDAIDVLHVEQGKIVEDWHIEDNVALLRQLGAMAD